MGNLTFKGRLLFLLFIFLFHLIIIIPVLDIPYTSLYYWGGAVIGLGLIEIASTLLQKREDS